MSAVTSSIPPAAATTAWWDTSEVELSPEFWKYQSEVRESLIALFSPLNITILVLLATLAYFRLRPSASSSSSTGGPRPITFRTFTPRLLIKHNGEKSPLNPDGNVYLAVRGKVYDVTSGRNFYGPGGPYENFAGRDATRGLACQSFDKEMLTEDLDGPLDTCEDLEEDQLENLKGWVEKFDEKYLIVGKLIAFNSKSSEF